jgi:hypothetical protein
MILVALSMAWSASHPARSSTIIEGRSFSLGTTPIGDFQRHTWQIQNGGSIPLKLRTRFTSGHCGFSLWLGQDYFVPAGESLTVSLTCPTPHQAEAAYSAHVDVLTDDPEHPRVRLRVFGVTGQAAEP